MAAPPPSPQALRSPVASRRQRKPELPTSVLDRYPRLSIETFPRVAMGTLVSGLIGASLGATKGGQSAQLRFRAEHAHKMPDSTTGWYLYHKSKNYHTMKGGIVEGLKMGLRTSVWSCMALTLESTVDRCRGTSDMFSTIVASLTVAGTFSLFHRFPLTTAARTAKAGLLFGFAYGSMQDLLGLARGRPIGYVEFIRRRLGGGGSVGDRGLERDLAAR